MSSLHSMKKEIKKNNLIFMPEMYTHTLGSVIISAYMLSYSKPDPVYINKKWHMLKRHPELVGFWIDDPDFIDKSLALFNMKRPEEFPVAMVQSDYNVLFMPYYNEQLYPLREDGIYPSTASKGKIYPINFTESTQESTNKSDIGESMPIAEDK